MTLVRRRRSRRDPRSALELRRLAFRAQRSEAAREVLHDALIETYGERYEEQVRKAIKQAKREKHDIFVHFSPPKGWADEHKKYMRTTLVEFWTASEPSRARRPTSANSDLPIFVVSFVAKGAKEGAYGISPAHGITARSQATMATIKRRVTATGSPYFARGQGNFGGYRSEKFYGPYVGPGGVYFVQVNSGGGRETIVSLKQVTTEWRINTVTTGGELADVRGAVAIRRELSRRAQALARETNKKEWRERGRE